jgi:hypothetical protein
VPGTRLTVTIAISPHETEEERGTQNEWDIGSTKTTAVKRFKLGMLGETSAMRFNKRRLTTKMN